jgi:hypothetical protein
MFDAYIAFQARVQPHAAALISPNRRSTYAQLDAEVDFARWVSRRRGAWWRCRSATPT